MQLTYTNIYNNEIQIILLYYSNIQVISETIIYIESKVSTLQSSFIGINFVAFITGIILIYILSYM